MTSQGARILSLAAVCSLLAGVARAAPPSLTTREVYSKLRDAGVPVPKLAEPLVPSSSTVFLDFPRDSRPFPGSAGAVSAQTVEDARTIVASLARSGLSFNGSLIFQLDPKGRVTVEVPIDLTVSEGERGIDEGLTSAAAFQLRVTNIARDRGLDARPEEVPADVKAVEKVLGTELSIAGRAKLAALVASGETATEALRDIRMPYSVSAAGEAQLDAIGGERDPARRIVAGVASIARDVESFFHGESRSAVGEPRSAASDRPSTSEPRTPRSSGLVGLLDRRVGEATDIVERAAER